MRLLASAARDVSRTAGRSKTCSRLWRDLHAGHADCRGLPEDTQNLRVQFPKIHGHHGTPFRMEDEIARLRGARARCLRTHQFAHTALDAIAFMSFAEDFAHGEADAGSACWDWLLSLCRARCEKPGHRGGENCLRRCLIDALIIRVLAQARGFLNRNRRRSARRHRVGQIKRGVAAGSVGSVEGSFCRYEY